MISFLQFSAYKFILKSYLCIADKLVGRARGGWKKKQFPILQELPSPLTHLLSTPLESFHYYTMDGELW